ncbi:MAG: DUF4097 family beta strand repeat-containing protein [Acidobacteriota bacterium]
MARHRFIPASFGLICLLLLAGGNLPAQDYERSFQLPEGGFIRVHNISGNVRVSGYSGATVHVLAFREGRDRDRVEIEDRSSADRVDLAVRYPDWGNISASVNFEIRVPASLPLNFESIHSVSGNVDMDGVTGQVKADCVSGNVTVTDVAGTVSASAVSGNVQVHISRLTGMRDMKFSSVSGNVTVRAPASLNAYVEMSTISGSLKTDFPIEVLERRYGPGKSARGKLGSGETNLQIRVVSGRVSLIKN